MKILIVDDNDQFREDLSFFLEHNLKHKIIAEAANGEEFLELGNIIEADIILMDLNMKEINGFESTKKILWQYPLLNIIAITMDYNNAILDKLIETGFKGFVYKTNIYEMLEMAIQTVNSGKLFFKKLEI
ncbi:MAG: response regulator [Bacteroidales bacterium]|nr:response regulator [Bacteroidales bacterium]